MRDEEPLPLESVRSLAAFVLLDLDYRVVSEHVDAGEACRALARFIAAANDYEATIYTRTPDGWVVY